MAETHRPVGMQQPRKEPAQRPRTKYGVEQFEHRLSVDLVVLRVLEILFDVSPAYFFELLAVDLSRPDHILLVYARQARTK